MPKNLKSANTQGAFNFSDKMSELEKLVAELEADNDVGLALQQFEKASELAQELSDYLDTAQNKVITIQKRFSKTD